MLPEEGVPQRSIVGRRIAFSDAERPTKYTLPFVDATWKVPFVVLDMMGRPPTVLEQIIELRGGRLRTPAKESDLRPIESIPEADFATLVHYDPWWAFRGISGVDRRWIDTIFASNIARPFRHKGRTYKIHDLIFSNGLGRLETIVAKDEIFRPVSLHPGDIDLLGLRPKPRGEAPRPSAMHPAKAL